MNNDRYFIKDGEFFVVNDEGAGVIPAQALHKYWKAPDGENALSDYENCLDRSDKLLSLFNKYCSKEDKILELGCNIGRNLNHLYNNGYKNLSGVDINNTALEKGKTIYPVSMPNLPLTCSSIEDFVYDNHEKPFDVIFTMAVMMHLHPSSAWVLRLLPQMINKYLIIAEEEEGINCRVFPRNYKGIFEALGMKQVFEEYCEYKNDMDDTGTVKLMYRIFKNET